MVELIRLSKEPPLTSFQMGRVLRAALPDNQEFPAECRQGTLVLDILFDVAGELRLPNSTLLLGMEAHWIIETWRIDKTATDHTRRCPRRHRPNSPKGYVPPGRLRIGSA